MPNSSPHVISSVQSGPNVVAEVYMSSAISLCGVLAASVCVALSCFLSAAEHLQVWCHYCVACCLTYYRYWCKAAISLSLSFSGRLRESQHQPRRCCTSGCLCRRCALPRTRTIWWAPWQCRGCTTRRWCTGPHTCTRFAAHWCSAAYTREWLC